MESGGPTGDTPAVVSEESVETTKRTFEAYNAGDMDALRELYAPDIVFRHLPDWSELRPTACLGEAMPSSKRALPPDSVKGRGGGRAVPVTCPDRVGAEAGPVDPVGRWVDRDHADRVEGPHGCPRSATVISLLGALVIEPHLM